MSSTRPAAHDSVLTTAHRRSTVVSAQHGWSTDIPHRPHSHVALQSPHTHMPRSVTQAGRPRAAAASQPDARANRLLVCHRN
eukprot:3721567-Prymnesium_polylepis.1